MKEGSRAYLLKGDSRRNRSREFGLKFKSGRNPDFQGALVLPVVKPDLHARVRSPRRHLGLSQGIEAGQLNASAVNAVNAGTGLFVLDSRAGEASSLQLV